MAKRLIPILILICFLASCAPAPASPTPPRTATVPPTRTPHPTQTSIPTATPYPALQTDGPYLLFTYDNRNFTIMDADGNGRKQFQLSNEGYTFQLNKSVSPDGKWLAYFTGSIKEPYDITLNLLNLSDGTTQPISNLLAQGFPANLEPIVESMVLGDPPIYDSDCFQSMECRRSRVQRELVNSLFSLDWSPDSQSIAFTAQIDGPSSDIYIYDVADKTIRQLTNELLNIYKINWAPNGQRILYEISSPLGNDSQGMEFHLVNLDGKEISFTEESLYKYLHWNGYDWIFDNLYLLFRWSDAPPHQSDFKILNTDTGHVKDVWPHHADFFAVNKENQTIVLLFKNHHNQSSKIAEGIYMVYPSGKYWKISDVGIMFVLMEGQKPYPIFAQDYNRRIYSISNDGSINALPWANDSVPWISPNGKWLLFRDRNEIALYTESYQPIKSWNIDVSGVIWRPDSLGIFLFMDKKLHYLSIPNGDPVVVDIHLQEDCSVQYCRFQYIWLP